ncbi:MAG: MFS transporter [Myxococcota bacterium]
MAHKRASIALLVGAEILGMCLWFSSSAVLADLTQEVEISSVRQAMLSSGVQFGFAIGAVLYAALGLADRYDPRYVFAGSAFAAALANAALLVVPVGGLLAVASRVLTGALLAGVYPVGMKIAVGWGTRDRGLLVGLLVGALTLGSAAPHLLSFLGGTDWRLAVGGASALAAVGGGLVFLVRLGPHHARAPAFRFSSLGLAWRDRRIRLAYAGYLGHMWELYALWAWIGVALGTAFGHHLQEDEALSLSKLTAFASVGIGALACVVAGRLADRIGKAETTILAMVGSGAAALVAAATFSASPAFLIAVVIVWGAFVIADSAQFSALVADFAPPELAGTLMTFQTALGFGLTVLTVQATPWVAAEFGWPTVFVGLALGPVVGTAAMLSLRRLTSDTG